MKIYEIFNGDKSLGEVTTENVHDALREGKRLWPEAGCAIFKGTTQREPMFLK